MGESSVHHRFVRADGSVKAYGEDVENGDEAIGFLEDNRKDKGDGSRCHGHGQRERLVEDVDGAFLQDDVADDTAAESACDGETDSANEIEFVLAGGKHARHGCNYNGEHLKPDGDGDLFARGSPRGRHGCDHRCEQYSSKRHGPLQTMR